jgi:acyl-CoA synthetase (AMP-forming)/AMP-acid ligase II
VTPGARRSPDLAEMWGTDVVAARFAAHDGLVYKRRPRSITDLLVGCERFADRVFLVQGERRHTFASFLASIEPAAQLLEAAGVRPGDRVMVLAYNAPEFVLACWAIWHLGAVPVLGNRWWAQHEIMHALELTRPALVITDMPHPGALPARAIETSSLRRAWATGGGGSLPVAAARPDEDQPGLILFTSGSSGAPKAVVLSHRSVIANQQNLLIRSRRTPAGLDPSAAQQVALICTPMFHVGGVSNLLTQMIVGGRLVMTRGRFDPGEVLALIACERVHSWGGVPTMATRVLEHPDFGTTDLSSLRSFPLGGAPISAALLERAKARLPQLRRRGLANTWGMTESGGFVTLAGNSDMERFPGTVGRPYPASELRIANPDDAGLGEILVRSATVMLGYLGEAPGAVDEDGWLRTGDLGHLNEAGYLFLDGRCKDIAIRAGENISCVNVERALLEHPAVLEAAVFGIPHEDLGEELAAVLRVSDASEIGPLELRAFLKDRLAYFEVPTQWRIGTAALPTLAGEKIDKKSLRADFTRNTEPTG